MYLTLLLVVIFLACLLMSLISGLWGNVISLFNVITAALLATNYYEPLANYLDSQAPSYTYLWDFVSIWFLFAAICGILRAVTDKVSTVKVRFKKPVELAGGLFFGAWIGWIMISFTLFSLHTAPLARNFMDGAFQPAPGDHMFMGIGPDRKWMAFVHTLSLSTGPLATGDSPKEAFDPNGEFIIKYGQRRTAFEKEPDLRVNKK